MRRLFVLCVIVMTMVSGGLAVFAGNQDEANKIARQLGQQYPQYNIEVAYQDGKVRLRGDIGNETERGEIKSFVQQMPQVHSVQESFTVGDRAPAPSSSVVQQPTFLPTQSLPAPSVIDQGKVVSVVANAPAKEKPAPLTVEASKPVTPFPTTPTKKAEEFKSPAPLLPATGLNPAYNRQVMQDSPKAPTATVSAPVPSVAAPSIATPSVAVPSVSVPNVAVPSVSVPNVAVPSAPVPVDASVVSVPAAPAVQAAPMVQTVEAPQAVEVAPAAPVVSSPYGASSHVVSADSATTTEHYAGDSQRPLGVRIGGGPAYPQAQYQQGQTVTRSPSEYNAPQGQGMVAGQNGQPNLPQYAWPSYADHPNYSQVAYPKQHGANAFPYIGPFYPYPQVPLGWRKVTMEWHDGYWWLDFNDGSQNGPFSPLFRQPTKYR